MKVLVFYLCLKTYMLESFTVNPDLSKEARDIFIWYLSQIPECYKQWVSTRECYFKNYFHSFPTLLFVLTNTNMCFILVSCYWINNWCEILFFFLSCTIHFLHVRFLCIFLFYNVRTSSSFLSLPCSSYLLSLPSLPLLHLIHYLFL